MLGDREREPVCTKRVEDEILEHALTFLDARDSTIQHFAHLYETPARRRAETIGQPHDAPDGRDPSADGVVRHRAELRDRKSRGTIDNRSLRRGDGNTSELRNI